MKSSYWLCFFCQLLNVSVKYSLLVKHAYNYESHVVLLVAIKLKDKKTENWNQDNCRHLKAKFGLMKEDISTRVYFTLMFLSLRSFHFPWNLSLSSLKNCVSPSKLNTQNHWGSRFEFWVTIDNLPLTTIVTAQSHKKKTTHWFYLVKCDDWLGMDSNQSQTWPITRKHLTKQPYEHSTKFLVLKDTTDTIIIVGQDNSNHTTIIKPEQMAVG